MAEYLEESYIWLKLHIIISYDLFLVYLDIGEGEMNTGKMAFAFDTTTSQVGRTFEIKVTQIFCNSPTR